MYIEPIQSLGFSVTAENFRTILHCAVHLNRSVDKDNAFGLHSGSGDKWQSLAMFGSCHHCSLCSK